VRSRILFPSSLHQVKEIYQDRFVFNDEEADQAQGFQCRMKKEERTQSEPDRVSSKERFARDGT
jgi:hypothetical protein